MRAEVLFGRSRVLKFMKSAEMGYVDKDDNKGQNCLVRALEILSYLMITTTA